MLPDGFSRTQNAPMSFGNPKTRRLVALRIRETRLRAGISRAVLAKRLRCPVRRIAAIEQGRRSVEIELLVRIARALKIDPATLLREMLD